MKLPPSPPIDAVGFCTFATASPTPFHAVANIVTRLLSAGFKPITEREAYNENLVGGGKYYYTRNQSSIVAFTLPPKPSPTTAVSFAVGHLDSPCLKVRPVSKKEKNGYLQVGVELYGGGLWHTWFDRDLSLAGRVIIADHYSTAGSPSFKSKLVKIDRPILRIPDLAIHLDRTMNDSFKFNKETQFTPILGLVAEQLNASAEDGKSRSGTPVPFSGKNTPVGEKDKEDIAGMATRHHPLLLAAIADELGVEIGDIQDFELSLFDTQPSTVGGLSNEFIFSPRCDNLVTCYASIEGLIEASENTRIAGEENIHCVILFDNEEVGSVSHHGAQSNLLPSFVERIVALPDYKHTAYHQLLSNSFLVSADMGHAINPNYAERYEPNHAPRLNHGVVIKTNANQRYTSNAQTTFILRNIAKYAGVPVQEFEIRNDSTCGSTVGPYLSTHVRTVDIGLAQLSMHSIRETAGSADIRHYINLFKALFASLSKIDRALTID